jgi:heterodisulfide reductase subunit C
VTKLDPSFCDEVAAQPGGEHVRRCYACGTCVAGCPVSEVAPEFSPRKIIRQILFGMREELLSSPEIWYCLVCYRCYARCPQKVNFTDVMRALRYLAIKGHHAPPGVLDRLQQIDLETQRSRWKKVQQAFDAELTEFLKRRRSEETDRATRT